MEQIKMYKNSQKYGFKKGDVYTVLRNVMNECVIIMTDEQKPNVVVKERIAKKIRNHYKMLTCFAVNRTNY